MFVNKEFNEYEEYKSCSESPFEKLASDLVKKLGIQNVRTSRNAKVPIIIEKLTLRGEVPTWVRYKEVSVIPPTKTMNQWEYNKEMQEVVSSLPEEFQRFVYSQSWEQGHSGGYEEVINIANELKNSLSGYISEYTQRLKEMFM